MINLTIPATKAKTEFAKLIDLARREPVAVTRNGRPVAVVISPEEYERFSEIDDAYWAERAQKAEAGGFIGKDKSADFMTNVLTAKK